MSAFVALTSSFLVFATVATVAAADSATLIGEPYFCHHDSVSAVTFSPSGRLVASVSKDNTVKTWDSKTRKLLSTHLFDSPFCLVFVTEATLAVADTEAIWIIDLEANKRSVFTKHVPTLLPTGEMLTTIISDIACSPDKTMIGWIDTGHSFIIKDIKTGRTILEHFRPVNLQEEGAASIAFSTASAKVAVTNGFEILLYDLKKRTRPPLSLPGHKGGVSSLQFSRDGALLFSGGWDEFIRAWDITTGKEIKKNRGFSAVLTPDGHNLVACDGYGKVKVTALQNPATEHEFPIQLGGSGIRGLSISPNGKTLATAGECEAVRFFDLKTGKEVWNENVQKGRALHFATAPTKDIFASACVDGNLNVWDIKMGRFLFKFSEPGIYRGLGFSTDGKQLVAGDDNGNVSIYNVASQKRQTVFKAHEKKVTNVWYLTPQRIVTLGSEGALKFWKTDAAGKPQCVKVHETASGLRGAVTFSVCRIALAFRDGILVFGSDGTLLSKLDGAGFGAMARSLDEKSLVVLKTTSEANKNNLWSISLDAKALGAPKRIGAVEKDLTLLDYVSSTVVVTVSKMGSIAFVNLLTGETKVLERAGDAVPVASAAYSRHHRKLLIGLSNTVMVLQDVTNPFITKDKQ